MLHVLTYAAALGLSVGILMMLASREGGEAFLLTVPLIAITIGLPTAVLFAILLPLLPDPLFGTVGSWRAVVLAPLVAAAFGTLKWIRGRRTKRASSARTRQEIVVWGSLSLLMGSVWGTVDWLFNLGA